MLIDSLAADIQSLLKTLEPLGIAAKHPKDLAAAAAHLDAYTDLEHLHSLAASFTAPMVDGANIETRLTAGEVVPDAQLIDYAARATAAGSEIGPAAQAIIRKAETTRVRGARDTLRGIFPALIEDLRAILIDAGDQPGDTLINALRTALTGIDQLAGRDVCDYWCIRNARTGKWAILDRKAAEDVDRSNEAYAKEQREKAARAAGEPKFRLDPTQKPRLLHRRPLPSSGFGGLPITAGDLADHQASKTSPQPLTR